MKVSPQYQPALNAPVTASAVACPLSTKRTRQSGMVLIWAAITMFVIILLVGLAIDTAWVWYVSHELQNAADASALAGAHEVRLSEADARNAATNVANLNEAGNVNLALAYNGANAAGGDIVIGNFDRSTQTFTPQTTNVNAVQVATRRTAASANGALPLLFSPIAGFTDTNVTQDAIAMIRGGLGAGVIALNPTASCSFDLRGTAGSFIVNDGVVVVNSDHSDAACHSGQPTVASLELHVHGETDKNWDKQVNFTGELYENSDPVPDPLAGLPEPGYDVAAFLDPVPVRVEAGITHNAVPGYYQHGLVLRNGTLNLSPGVYVVDGEGFDINGGVLNAEGVMIFIVDTTPGDAVESRVDIRGNGIVNISPPDTSMYSYPASPDITPYSDAAVSIFQARNNTNDSRILGTADFLIYGTLYFPSNEIEIGGTSANIANGLIADTIYAHGDGDLVINYDDRFGRLPRHVFLVE